MYRLIYDREYLDGYHKILKEFGVDEEHFSATSYRAFSPLCRPIVSSIHGGDLLPVRILVSIRTDRTNELIVPDDGKFYTDCTTEYPSQHPLDDACLLAMKSMVDKYFDCGEDLHKVIPHTAPLIVGACCVSDVFYVYATLVVDCTLKGAPHFKLKGCHYEKIADITPADDMESRLLQSLPVVNMQKEVNTDVSDHH